MKPLIACMLFLILFSCAGSKFIEQTRLGESALLEMDYQRALGIAEGVIASLPVKQKMEHGQVYSLAGNSAYALEQYQKSIEYLEKARQLEYSDELMYYNLAGSYRQIDNLSKEIGVLEDYIRSFPEGIYIGQIRERLFQTCRESMNYDLAMDLWPMLADDARSEVGNMEIYLEINSELGNESTCDELASVILKQHGENEVALNYLAEKYFWKAENSYLAEMKAYKNNRTHKQYAILLKTFKTVNSDFKKSLDYFVRLYKVNPDPGYAGYLSRIYTRLEDEQKANFYRRKAEQD